MYKYSQISPDLRRTYELFQFSIVRTSSDWRKTNNFIYNKTSSDWRRTNELCYVSTVKSRPLDVESTSYMFTRQDRVFSSYVFDPSFKCDACVSDLLSYDHELPEYAPDRGIYPGVEYKHLKYLVYSLIGRALPYYARGPPTESLWGYYIFQKSNMIYCYKYNRYNSTFIYSFYYDYTIVCFLFWLVK